ncbi:glutathione hydrolase 5 proenzyme isoform X4 [Manis pentadactyla]|uniref:glutathione hydrolase 5 proenzyme isoform X4 n=1 Tax=Manis pentadactyla TaxID=143292 RepID=UPI00255CEF25|nr:glutathione hydrolase 5 proenzyme isoform X4 [Manis pentadactyla]
MGRYKWRHNLQCRELCTCEQLDARGQPGVVSHLTRGWWLVGQSSVTIPLGMPGWGLGPGPPRCAMFPRAILQRHGSSVDAAIAALVCTGAVNPQSMGLGGGVIFTIFNVTTGKVEVINARETVPNSYVPGLLEQCEQAQPLGTGSRLTLQDLASFQPQVVDALAVPLGDYTLYSPPPPAGGAILSFILNVLKGFNFSSESVARPEGSVNLYHHLVETLKFAGGQRWRLWDPRSHLEVQNASQDLLGEALAQHIRQQIDARGDHQLSHYNLAGAGGPRMGTAHVSVLGEDGSAVAATSTINTPFGAMVYSPHTGILLNNELLDLCWRQRPGSGVAPPPVPGERPPSSMVPSILVNAAQGSKLVIGGAGGELITSAVAQAIINKLWLGFDLRAAIVAPILHVDDKGQVEYEPGFSQEVQKGLQARGQNQTRRLFFLNVVQAVSQEGACVHAVADPRKGGEASGY